MLSTAALVLLAAGSFSAAGDPGAKAPGLRTEGPGLRTEVAGDPGAKAPGLRTQQAPQQVQPPAEARTEILEQILVKVNGEIFTKTELENRQVVILRQRNQQLSEEELGKALLEVTPELLVDAIDEMLMLQRGKELGYKVSDEQFKRVLDNIRKENKLEDDVQFEAALKQEGLDVAALRKNIERSMVMNQVQQVEVWSRITVTEDEATAYYNQHRNEFTTPSQYTLRELSVSVKTDGATMNVAADEAAKAKVEEALARARKGEKFETLVAEVSDSPSKDTGGLVGPINESDLDPAIVKLLTGLRTGDTTDVFRTRGGWAILKVEEAKPAQMETLEQARDKIADRVYKSRQREEMLKYIQKLRAQAIIDWKNIEMKRLWETRVGAESSQPAR
ncbi:MAG: peptidyl-prolyl cis-trans isomerase [Vicinamibacterales bacterium]|nr:peptidyl-prolyl cis-trans isomerase [Vicinamibacterales bacterium]